MLQEKYRPQSLHDMDRIPSANILKSLHFNSISNLVLVGPEGAGKRTLFSAFLRHNFGSPPAFFSYTSVYEVSPSKSVEVDFLESKEVLEVKIEGLGMYDKKVLQKVASDISATKSIKNILNQNQNNNPNGQTGTSPPKILLISDGDHLSTGAQMALRRVLEKGASNFRLVLLTTSISHLIPAFKSRFLLCRVPSPTDTELAEIVCKIATEERGNISADSIQKIVSRANGNIRIALSLLELALHKEPLSETPWDKIISEVAAGMRTIPTITYLIETRAKIYSLLDHQLPSNYILLSLMNGLLKKEKNIERARTICELAAKYTARMSAGTRDLFHIEAFIANSMVLYAD